MEHQVTKSFINALVDKNIDFANDKIWLYIVDRKLNLHNKLTIKSDISKYILYQKQLLLETITNEYGNINISYKLTNIKYNNQKHPSLGNVIIYNETINCVMSYYEIDKEEIESIKLPCLLERFMDFLGDFPPAHISTVWIPNIKYSFSKDIYDL